MKIIKRSWVYNYDYTHTIQGEANFIATGETNKGGLFYSMIDQNGNIDPKHEGSFIQVRHNHKLLMVRI